MRVITSQEKAEHAADDWMNRYLQMGKWVGNNDSESTHKKLASLKHPTPEKVVEIIGNNSWVTAECNICGQRVGRWLQVRFDTMDSLRICGRCLSVGYHQMFPNGE